MSGSSGGRVGGGGSDEAPISCELLQFETGIASPNPEVVPRLKMGEQLLVIAAAASKTQEIQVVTADKELVGGLLATKVQRFRECMLEGHAYKATVRSVIGGQVRVVVDQA